MLSSHYRDERGISQPVATMSDVSSPLADASVHDEEMDTNEVPVSAGSMAVGDNKITGHGYNEAVKHATIFKLSVKDPQRPSIQSQKTLKRVNITTNGSLAHQAMESVPAANELLA